MENTLRKRILELAKNLSVKVGYFETDLYPDGKKVAENAAIQEYGSIKNRIPPRPTMRPGFAKSEAQVKKLVSNLLTTETSLTTIYNSVGQVIEDHIRHEIDTLFTPPLSERTIHARLSRYESYRPGKKLTKKQAKSISKPLIDTEVMISSLTHIVSLE